MIECSLLGRVLITMDGGAAPRALHWKKHLGLLVYLACSPRRLYSRQHLADLLWGDRDDPHARHSLNEAAHVLRRSLGKEAVIGSGDELGIEHGALTVDLERFAELATQAAWTDAAALVRGDFLDGFEIAHSTAFEDWVTSQRVAWRSRSLDALTRASALECDRGDLSAALSLAARATALDPLSDRAVQALMRAQALRGDREDAFGSFAQFAERIRADVNAEPDAETAALARAIRAEPRRHRVERPKPDVLPLTGREAELAALIQVWDAVRAGRAGMLVVYGPSGIGRTRLLGELMGRAALDGAVVGSARAVTGDTAAAGGTLLALVATLLDAPGVAGADPAALATLAAAEPAWAERFRTSGTARLPLVAASRAIITAIADEGPVVLAVDDAQWADDDSLAAFGQLVRDLSGHRVLLALTALDHPVRAGIERLAAHTGRDVPGRVVTLAPLTLEGAEQLAGLIMPRLGHPERQRLARRVMHDTAGSPLLVSALLHAVRSGLDLEAEAWPAPSRTFTATLPGPLPDALAAAIRLVFRELSGEAQRVGAAAAVLGERFVASELSQATDLPRPSVEVALDELERRGWVLWDPRGYSFGAQLTRAVIARDMLTPGKRRRIRDRAARMEPPPPAGS